jgi:hypothetical protein
MQHLFLIRQILKSLESQTLDVKYSNTKNFTHFELKMTKSLKTEKNLYLNSVWLYFGVDAKDNLIQTIFDYRVP